MTTDRTTGRTKPWTGCLFLAAAAGALGLSGCTSSVWQTSETINGSGTVTTETIDISTIEGIDICCDLDIVINAEDGLEETAELTVDDNIHDELKISVSNDNILEIEPRRNNVDLQPTRSIVLHVTGHEITSLSADSNSRVDGDFADVASFSLRAGSDSDVDINVKTDDLTIRSDSNSRVSGDFGASARVEIDASSDSDVDINVEAADVRIKSDSNSSVTGDFGKGERLDIDADSDSEVTIDFEADDVTIKSDSNSTVELAGRATIVDVDASSDSDVRLTSATVVDATVRGDSNSSIELEASGLVSGKVSSDSSLDVWGDARVEVETSSSGSVNYRG